MTRPPMAWLVCLLLLAPTVLCCCGCGRRTREAEVPRPEQGLAAFIDALEGGSAATAALLVPSGQREDFTRRLHGLSSDELTAIGLQFRQEAYELDEQSGEMAVFWSEPTKAFLVMLLEDGVWRVDPRRTDEMNAEPAAAAGAVPAESPAEPTESEPEGDEPEGAEPEGEETPGATSEPGGAELDQE